MSELCAAFGISRNTGYRWLRRYRSEGPAALEERSRAPLRHGRRMAPEIAEAIFAPRRDRPRWGPRKPRIILQARHPELSWPAPGTIGEGPTPQNRFRDVLLHMNACGHIFGVFRSDVLRRIARRKNYFG
jgi:hypothetical protein